MDINRKNMDFLFQGFNNCFADALAGAENSWQKFCCTVPSGSAANIYPFLEQFGGMREWVGDRQIKNVASGKLEVVNRDFEDTVSIPRNDIEDDQYGVYSMLIAQMGANAGKLWQTLAVKALLAEDHWMDDKAFFSEERFYGESPIVNKSSATLSADSYSQARRTMMEYCGHNNSNLGIMPSLLITGPKNEEMAFSILKDRLQLRSHSAGSVSGVGTAENPWNNSAELLILPELSGEYEDCWFLCAVSGVLKPVFVQQRKLPALTRLDHDSDENVFSRKEYIYGTDARGEAFKAFPHLIYRGGKA